MYFDETYDCMLNDPVILKENGDFGGILGLPDCGKQRVLLGGATNKQYEEICQYLYCQGKIKQVTEYPSQALLAG